MLDLLYVPSKLTPFGSAYQAATNLAYNGTYGGATSGRINPNGAVVYTTNVTVSSTRHFPLASLGGGLSLTRRN